ncbi:MAG: glycine cleavage system aminomethyltransferase GcvT [Bacteroidota bacterium]
MKRTIFYQSHVQMGAKIVPFAGFEMPVEYSGVRDEHIRVRQGVGLFDVSHMGEFWVKGPQAAALVQYVTSNDINKLQPGKIQYSCLPNGKGGIVDDLLVYMYEEEKYLLVVNAANIDKDWEWINRQNKFGAILENASDHISQLAIQGPDALNLLQNLTDINLSSVPYYTFVTGKLAGIDDVIISNTGYTGAGGFELYFNNQDGQVIWDRIFETGASYDLIPVGLAARDTLRLEMGYCLYGNDITDTTSPIEAGLGWITKFTEGNDFIDRPLLEKQRDEGVSRKLIGFEMLERGIPRQHYPLVDKEGKQIGEVTSGTMSPMLNKGIGMAYVEPAFAAPGSSLWVEIRGKHIAAEVVKLPFYKNN